MKQIAFFLVAATILVDGIGFTASAARRTDQPAAPLNYASAVVTADDIVDAISSLSVAGNLRAAPNR